MQEPRFRSLARYPILAVGLAMVGFVMIKTGRDAVFFQENGLYQLPLAYIWIAVAAVPASMLHLNAIERWGARKARTRVFYVAALLFLLCVPFVDQEQRAAMSLMFILVPTIFAAVFAGAWLLAGDLLEGADRVTMRWAYSRIGAASMVGGILGGLLAKSLSLFLGPAVLVGAGALVLAVVGLLVSLAHRNHPFDNRGRPQKDIGEDKTTGPGPVFGLFARQSELIGQPYVLALIGISGLATLAALFIDFQFYAATMISGNNNAQFFASFYILLNAASLCLQLAVAPRLQSKLGVGGALMLLPTALLGCAGAFSFTATLQARAILKVTEGGLKSSIHRSIWEQVFLTISRERREVAKAIVDGMFTRIFEGIGAAALYIWLSNSSLALEHLNLSWISWAIIGVILVWIGLTAYLNRIGCSDIDPDETVIRLPDSCPCVSCLGAGRKR